MPEWIKAPLQSVPLRIVVICAVAIIALIGWLLARSPESQELVLYGNVDLRQIELAFNNSERISEVLAQEGDHIKQGQVLARLDTSRLEAQTARAAAEAAAQREAVARLHNGSRPEEIAQARANVQSATADAVNARRQYARVKDLASEGAGRVVSQQTVDNAKAALETAQAKLAVSQRALDLAVAGPRNEDVSQGEAQLRADEAQLAFQRQALADAQLIAPVDADVRTRLMEVGEMASPQRPVFSLAVTDPKWVRVYVSEKDLGKVRAGMAASIIVDSFPGQKFSGWVGFISPIAEFTPKIVQTADLRTSLVYEVRVFAKDPSDQLHLGSPATVYLSLDSAAAASPRS